MVGVAAGFGLLAVIVTVAALSVLRNREVNAAVSHTWHVEAQINEVQTLFERAESSRRGYLIRRDPRFSQGHNEVQGQLPEAIDALALLVSDNSAQVSRVAELRELLAERAVARNRAFALVDAGRLDTAVAEFGAAGGSREVLRSRAIFDTLRLEERRLLGDRQDWLRDSQRLVNITMIVSGLLLALLAAASMLLLRRYTVELAASRNQLRQLNVGLEDAVAARTADLQRANDEIQRFAYIVSHDLRSPLVNVMGFTSELEAGLPPLGAWLAASDARDRSLVPPEAREFVERDLKESVGFIRASTSKMDRLINAILRLSREGRRVLAPEHLNMQVLFDQLARSEQARAEAVGARITVQWPIPDIVNDRVAMEQVFGNLIDNALKYLSEARPGLIVLRGRADGAWLIYEVEDNGRGIDARDHDRVFELFRRAGAQNQPGEGLGLAHVRALVHRLGGTITVDSALDVGSTFRVSLPPQPPNDSKASA